ncbi:MAG: hypothetical protein K0R46_2307 [Herbinix sp.]|jgi:hypothetical protein|nr:hypothetical protein [Herbinix sp.]
MKVKRLAAFLLGGTLFLAQSISAQAQMPSTALQGIEGDVSISPQWTNVNDITLDLYFENGEAGCSGKIRALSGTTKISATFKLERKISSGWALEKSWGQSSSTDSLSFFGTDAVLPGYTYRLSVTADVTRNGMTETVSTSVEGYY